MEFNTNTPGRAKGPSHFLSTKLLTNDNFCDILNIEIIEKQ